MCVHVCVARVVCVTARVCGGGRARDRACGGGVVCVTVGVGLHCVGGTARAVGWELPLTVLNECVRLCMCLGLHMGNAAGVW